MSPFAGAGIVRRAGTWRRCLPCKYRASDPSVLYLAYQAHADFMQSIRDGARWTAAALNRANHQLAAGSGTDRFAAAFELLARTKLTHQRPSFRIEVTNVGDRTIAVREEPVCILPFGTLLRFTKDVPVPQPRVLLVAPLSGHFATLLRGTVETLLPENDVYITDWHNARDVSMTHGRFGFDQYVEHLMSFLEAMGPGVHVVAVCQSCVQALAAVAILSEAGSVATPRSMTLMAGPVDTRVNPTKVNELATARPIEWFEHNLIASVPSRFPGARRRVYPGFVQLTAFMSMNLERHIKAHVEMYECLASGDHERADAIKTFYDEYFAVLDLPAEFYLETVKWVFQEHWLPLGKLRWQGHPVDFAAIRRTALLTVEGERDDICSVGQTVAAHELCTGLRPYMRRHHMQPGEGHYGVFSGKRWQSQIYPLLRHLILASD